MPPRSSLIPQDETSLEDFRTSDVIFGTRGNGGNSSFLSRLEEASEEYSRLSKYEKMECIKSIISNWHGRFFIITPDGNCSQVLQFEATPSSKLYTSVRRMMNYVIKKKSLSTTKSTKQRATSSRDRKRLRRIRVVLEKDQQNDDDSHDGNDAPTVVSATSEDLDHMDVERIARLEDSAINTLVGLLSSHPE